MAELFIPTGYALAGIRLALVADPEEMLATFTVKLSGASTDPTEMASDVFAAWLDAIPANQLGNAWSLRGIIFRQGPLGEGPVAELSGVTDGTATGAMLPQNCALLIRKNTAFSGRRNRGRFFLPSGYLPEGSVDGNGMLSSTQLSGWQGLANTLLENLTTAVSPNLDGMYVSHYMSAGQDPDDFQPTPVTSLSVQSQIATQRRRMRR